MQPERPVAGQDGPGVLAYIGTYTNSPLLVRGNGEGIYVCRLDSRSGALIPAGLTARAVNPSFLALHPEHRYLYAVVEVGGPDGQLHGSVSAFSLDPVTGALTFLNQHPSGGDGPCHLSVDRTGRLALVANYESGSVAVLRSAITDSSESRPKLSSTGARVSTRLARRAHTRIPSHLIRAIATRWSPTWASTS